MARRRDAASSEVRALSSRASQLPHARPSSDPDRCLPVCFEFGFPCRFRLNTLNVVDVKTSYAHLKF